MNKATFNLSTFNVKLGKADTAALDLQEYVVGTIVTRADIKKHVVAYVAKKSGVKPHASRKGGEMTFKHNSTEANQVSYLMGLIYNVPKVGKAKQSDPVAKFASAVKSAKAAGLTKAQALRAFELAWKAE
tara:strand:- start:92 stop:481 length:390 start_codon:yes stop_codon:yes gene_type:complete